MKADEEADEETDAKRMRKRRGETDGEGNENKAQPFRFVCRAAGQEESSRPVCLRRASSGGGSPNHISIRRKDSR